MAHPSLRARRQRAWIVLAWLVLAVLLIAGVVVAITVNGAAGVVLFGVGAVGYLVLGAIVFMFMPRRNLRGRQRHNHRSVNGGCEMVMTHV